MIAIPINLIITTLLLGLIIFLAYIFLNKLTKGSSNYIPPEHIENPQNPEENDHSNNNRNHNHNQRRNNNNINDFQNQEQNINPDSFKKLTKKEQIKMQKKQERKEQRDAMLLAMEEKKRREQEKQMQLLLKEKEKEEEAKRIEEEAKRIAEEKKKKEDEEYDKWRDLIKVGAKAITVHGRTRVQGYTGKVDLDIIKKVKESVSIPVIGNGDIKSCYDAKYMMDYTKCDAVMIGRGILGNPWLIKECVEYLEQGIIPKEVSIEEKFKMIKRHMDLLMKTKSEKVALLEMRTHISYYLKGISGTKELKQQIFKTKTKEEIIQLLDDFIHMTK